MQSNNAGLKKKKTYLDIMREMAEKAAPKPTQLPPAKQATSTESLSRFKATPGVAAAPKPPSNTTAHRGGSLGAPAKTWANFGPIKPSETPSIGRTNTAQPSKLAQYTQFLRSKDYMSAYSTLCKAGEDEVEAYNQFQEAREARARLEVADPNMAAQIERRLKQYSQGVNSRMNIGYGELPYDQALELESNRMKYITDAKEMIARASAMEKELGIDERFYTKPYSSLTPEERELRKVMEYTKAGTQKFPYDFTATEDISQLLENGYKNKPVTIDGQWKVLNQQYFVDRRKELEARISDLKDEDRRRNMSSDQTWANRRDNPEYSDNVAFNIQGLEKELDAIIAWESIYDGTGNAEAGREKWLADGGNIDPIVDTSNTTISSLSQYSEHYINEAQQRAKNEKRAVSDDDIQRSQTYYQEILGNAYRSGVTSGNADLGIPLLNDVERELYFTLYDRDGKEAANTWLYDTMRFALNKRASEYAAGAQALRSTDGVLGTVGSTAASVLMTPAKIPGALYSFWQQGNNQMIDPNAAVFGPTRYAGTVRDTQTDAIIKKYGKGTLLGEGFKFLYAAGTSAADSTLMAMLGGGMGLGSVGTTVMHSMAGSSDSMLDAFDRGGSQDQAVGMLVASLLAETATELAPTDFLFRGFSEGFSLKGLIRQMGSEALGEGTSEILTTIADRRIMLDKSQYDMAVKSYRAGGRSQEQAERAALNDVVGNALYAAGVGAAAGGGSYVMAGIGSRIADNEAKISAMESAALETAARERMDFETRDGEAAKKYSELVKLATDTLPPESATRALIADKGPLDEKRMKAVADSALSEYSELLKTNPSDEMAEKAQALNKAIDALYTGIKTDRDTTVDKYTAGLDEAVKSEIKGKTGEEAVTYAKGYGIAHALGQMGVPLDTIAKATGFKDAKKAAEEGRAKWDVELPKAKNKADVLRKTLPLPGKGSVTYHSNVKRDALTTGQRDQIGLLEKVAEPMGYRFVMVEFEKDAAGNYVTEKGQIAPNGYFRDTDGTIYIDVNAGKTAGRMVEDTIIPQTAGHELTHYLKANSPELFRAYSAAVIDELIAKGQDINALIAQKIGRAKQSSIGVEAALEEVIADSSAMMLQNTQAIQKMAETNPGLIQKIAEWVKDFVDSIRKAFSKVEGTPEAKALMSMRDGVMKYADSLQQMYDNMMVSTAQAKLDEKPVTVTRRDVQAVAKEAATKKTAYTSDGQAVDYHYELVPVGSLIPSNLEANLEPNPDYPQELQPRDRTRAASQQQVEEIANKLNPALLGESADVGTGAPFVGPDMVVESGNGRILAITRAMRQGKALTYTQWLKDNAARFGVDPAKVDNASVLVRVRDTEVNRPEFVQKANESQVATYSDSESAVSDAKKVTPAMLEMANMDSGDINSAGNSGFVASFISKVVPVAERGRMMDANGKLSKSGENRVRTALFQMAYEDGYLTEQMAEASDDTSKNILKAMTAVAPRLALMNDAMKKGTLSEYPIGQAIAEAYRIVQRQKRLGVSVDRYINQQSLVRQDTPAHWMLLEMFNENRNAPNRMADALNAILNAAERQGNPNQMLMPGLEAERPSVEGIVRDGLNRYADEATAASERYQERDSDNTPLTPEQIEYFKDSKVRDEDGKLLVVYHGTDASFNVFDRTKSRANMDIQGNFFSPWEEDAAGYGRNVRKFYLNITNPATESIGYKALRKFQGQNNAGTKARDYLIQLGYDGVDNGSEEYIAFSPEQIKSTTNLTPTSSPDIRYQERDPAPAMYSKMAKVIEAYKADKLGADSVVKYLQGRGVKADEIRWSGIVPFLQGKKSVSKAELLEFARASALDIKDVTKKGPDISRTEWNEWAKNDAVQTYIDDAEKTINVYSNDEPSADIYYNSDAEVYTDYVTDRQFDSWDDALEYAEEHADEQREYWLSDDAYGESTASSDKSSFYEYALQDGRRYREFLFTAPDLPGAFRSQHWGEQNVLAHTRLQDFETPDGKPVLFIEEVQSDWHEKGREEGYAKPVNVIIGEYKSQGKEGYPDIAQVHDDNENLIGYIMPMHGKYVADAGNGQRIGAYETEKQALDALAENEMYRFSEVPEAPFATTWHEYVLKRVLRMAAEGGYDYVGWTTGKMQADRYSLATSIGSIEPRLIEDNVQLAVYNPDGRVMRELSHTYTQKELADTYGKDLSRRIMEAANEGEVLEGENLYIGGEGMKAFYDIGGKSSQNIPRFLNKYGAQWGAKIQTIDMQGSENTYQVPAIEVTDAMKESVLYEGQPLYQERDPDYRTKRDILAGAFDSVAQTESEKRNLKEYKNLIGSLNRMEEEARTLRQANTAERKKSDRDKAVIEKNTKRIAEIEERINNLDKRLLKMQNAAPLRNVLKREVDYYKKQQSALNKQRLEKYRADRAETSMKQRYRGDISKGVKSLNNMLMNESDQKHIPEGFKGAVVDFLRLFTDNTSVFDYKRLSVLKEMYDALETSDSELAGMYDFDTAQDIAEAAQMLEGKRLSQLTEAELEKMRDIVAHFNHIVKNENQIFTQKRSVKITDAAEELLSEYGKKAKEMRLALLSGKNPIAAINKFLTSKTIKPVYFFKRVGGILQELFDDIRAAQGKWAFHMSEDRNFFRNTVNKYNYYKWVDDGQLTFTTARGDQITLTREQALELYAINKREKTNKQQGAEHLPVGGFVYEDAVKVKKKSALGVPMTYEVNVGENHPLTDSDLDQISKWLTNEQRAYADEMVNYLSTTMGERGNEVSLAMYGIRKYTEKYYFPYKSASNFLYSHQGGAQDDSAIKHRSFTKRTTVSANNPVVLTGFTKVWADHVQNMNLYNTMAVPLDNFNRVYNYRIRGDKDATKAQSVKAALEAAYGKEANAYIKQLLNDVNGGIRPDKGDAEARKMMSLWKKGAVFASLSVVVQQPSAIGRALALVDPKYFRKGYTKAGYEEMMKWSGTANIKAMGRFDANMGMTAAGWLTQKEYTGMDEKAKAFAKDGSFRDDVLSWMPQKADEMTWTALWEAVKRETASKYGNLIGTDAFMQKVAERFDEVVDYTQVYDSVLSKSEVMRSQSGLAQMVTAFMAEPTTAYNMLLDSIVNAKNKGMKNYVKPGRALGAFVVSVLLNSIPKAMVTAGRDDDEKYTYLEKYLRKLSGSIVDELNPLGLVPYGRDILSLWEGYDVERADMSVIGGLVDAVKKMGKPDMPLMQKADTLAGAIGNALGVPYKNVRRDIQGVYNVLASSAPLATQSASGAKYSLLEGLPWFDASRAGYARKLYSAIMKGDAQEEAGLREQMSKIVKKDSDINTELRNIITTEFEEERLEPRIALQQMIDLTELKEITGRIGAWYKDGLIGQDVAEQLLVEFTKYDQPNERYKKIEEWNYSKNPDNEGERYSTYKAFYEAIDSGKDLRAVVNTYMDPKKYGASKSTLSDRIRDTYKEQYIETYKRSRTEAAALKARLLNAYVLIGYDRDKKSKEIDAWLN